MEDESPSVETTKYSELAEFFLILFEIQRDLETKGRIPPTEVKSTNKYTIKPKRAFLFSGKEF